MSATLSFTVDTRELEASLSTLAREARVIPGLVFADEAKQIATALIKLTPPANYAQGRKAVSEDVGRVFTTVPTLIKRADDSGKISDVQGFKTALVRAFRKGDDAAMEKLLTGPVGPHVVAVKGHTRRNGSVVRPHQAKRPGRPVFPGIVAGATKFGGALNPALHINRRNNRGRVTGGQFTSQVVKPAEFKAYVKKIQSRVGWHASGWAALALQSGAKVPAWITKQRLILQSGSASINFGTNPHIRAVNRDVKIPGYQRTIDAVVNNRIRVTATKIQRLIDGKATNLGFTRIAAR